MSAKDTGAKILIIGAGAAGIAASTKLLLSGFENVLVLEAEQRIGGRIWTTDFAGSKIDLGAQWVHGEGNNVCYELASPYGVLASSEGRQTLDWNFVCAGGKMLSKEISRDIMKMYHEIYDELEKDQNIKPGMVFGSFFEERFGKKIRDNPNIPQDKFEEIFRCIELCDASITACETWYEVSAMMLRHYHTCDGDQHLNWKTHGFSTILDILMKKYSNPEDNILTNDKILLGKRVELIDYNSEDEVIVVTSDGSRFSADHVIVTVSLGVLKDKYQTLFRPMLPFSKQQCIEGLGFGGVDKIVMEFPHRWWPKNEGRFLFLLSSTEKQDFCKSLSENQKWLCDVFGIMGIDFLPRFMFVWITGASAKFMEQLTDEQVLSDLHRFLKFVFSDTYDIPRPEKILRSKWITNNNFRGSYSFHSITTERLNVTPNILSAPIEGKHKEPKILFAGEATHEQHYSTVHGAIESGNREAQRLIDYLR